MAIDFDLTITREELNALAPALLETVREFVGYGLCRQANAVERKSLAEHYAKIAHDTLRQFPTLKLNHMGAKTIIVDAVAPACPTCGSTEGQYVPPGSGDSYCLHCNADWPVTEGE